MATEQRPAIGFYPVLRYNDAEVALAFLGDAFGFEQSEVHKGPDGKIAHAELTFGSGMVMISERGSGDAVFDTDKQSIYVVAEDVDAVHDRAVAAGAEIVYPLTDQDYGSRDFAAKDPEGNVWSFGTYQPMVTHEV